MSNNLGWTTLLGSDVSKADKINANREVFDASITEVLTIPNSTSPTLTTEQLKSCMIVSFEEGNEALQTLTIPDGQTKLFGVINKSSLASVRVTKGETVEYFVGPNSGETFYVDGLDSDGLHLIGPLNSQEERLLVFNVYTEGQYASSQLVDRLVLPREYTLPIDLTSSIFRLETAPSDGATSFNILKNGVAIGSIDFALGSTSATFTFNNNQSFQPGDTLSIEAPVTADSSLSGLFGVLEFTEVLPEDAGPGAIPVDLTTFGSVTFMGAGHQRHATLGSVTFVGAGHQRHSVLGSTSFIKVENQFHSHLGSVTFVRAI